MDSRWTVRVMVRRGRSSRLTYSSSHASFQPMVSAYVDVDFDKEAGGLLDLVDVGRNEVKEFGMVEEHGSTRNTNGAPHPRVNKGLGKVRRNPCCRNLLIGGTVFDSHMAPCLRLHLVPAVSSIP